MRHKLPPRRETAFSSSLKLRSVLLTVLLLSPWVGALLAVPGDASATSIGLPPGYNTCYEQYSVVGWIQVISHGEGGGGISTPTTSCLQDGWTSYDDVLYVIVSPSISAPTTAYVVIEQYTPGTVTVYQNETTRNGTTVLVPVQVPIRMNPYWSNATFTVYPATQTGVIMSLNYSADGNPMVVAVGGTSYQWTARNGTMWSLDHISPPMSSLQGIYDAYGLNATLDLFGVILAAFLGIAFAAAARFARKYHRAPRVPYHWWPAFLIGTPVVLFIFDFIPFDQATGLIGPVLFPAAITAAAFPYMPNLWRDAKMCAFLSYDGKSQRSQNAPLAVMPLVPSARPIACAPETWREIWHCALGAPLPTISTVKLKKGPIEVEHELDPIAVTHPLGAWYATDADLLAWQNHDHRLVRTRHHYARIDKVVQKEVVGPDGTVQVVNVHKKTILPHCVLGHLDWNGPPPEEVLAMQTGVRTVEQEAMRNKTLQIWVAELRSRNMEMVAQAREETEDRMEAERDLFERPMSETEMAEQVAVDQRKREPTPAEVGDVREPERAERNAGRSSHSA